MNRMEGTRELETLAVMSHFFFFFIFIGAHCTHFVHEMCERNHDSRQFRIGCERNGMAGMFHIEYIYKYVIECM